MLDDLLETAALDLPARTAILQLMDSPERHYHDLSHLGVLWSRHRRFSRGSGFAAAEPSRLIACAIAFHDAVYDPLRSDNEARSAALWRQMAPADLPVAPVAWVSDAIEATADHLAFTDMSTELARLRLWMLDLDLTPLGEQPAIFARNSRALRREYATLDDTEWHRRRLGLLERFLAAPQIYRSPSLAAAFERQARENIAQVLQSVPQNAAAASTRDGCNTAT